MLSKECAAKNKLRRMCSIQTAYLCGSHADCVVHWNTVDSSNFKEKLGAMILRAKKNMDEEILFTGVVEEMYKSFEILEMVLPTYFEGILGEHIAADKAASESDSAFFDRDFTNANGAYNKAPPYQKPSKEEREQIIREGLCFADLEIWKFAKQKLEKRHTICKRGGAGRLRSHSSEEL